MAASPTLNAAIQTVDRRMLSQTMWLEDETKFEDIKKEYTYLLAAFKRQKGDSAEKTMRQIMTYFSTNASEETYTPTQEKTDSASLNA